MAEIENKDDVSDELDSLAALLSDAGLCEDTGPLTRGAGFCRTNSNVDAYTYQINRLIFNLAYSPGGTLPNNKNLDSLKVILTINLKGKYLTNFDVIVNPFFNLRFDIELQCSDLDQNQYISAWHLDKHISSLENGKPKYHHPEYHMAFGGECMMGNYEYGNLFLLPSPRLCYPPMEAILGIDFILRNFYERDLNEKLFNDTTYIKLIKKAQYRFWRPFSIAFASRWQKFPDITIKDDFSYSALYPELF